MTSKSGELYRKFASGVVVIRAQDANWNADFSGWPRKLPDGRFYSTDKALKYAIRKYLKEVKNQSILFWRVYNENGDVGNLPAMLEKNGIKFDVEQQVLVKNVLQKGTDVRFFGGTFTLKDHNFSITGPIQITYGVDVYGKGTAYVSQIQSPKSESKKRTEESKVGYEPQSTLGSEVRVTEAHYAFDFTINPNNLEKDDYIELIKDKQDNAVLLSKNDVEMFKDALKFAPNYITSTTKAGVFTELVIFAEFEMTGDKVPLVPILRDGIKIGKTDNSLKRKIDISQTLRILKKLGAQTIELFYNKDLCDVEYESDKSINVLEI
ncbi:MAG: type I CRISPR-associated protein Cas7 [Candidatus Micrarchaeia archaeon]